MYLKRNNDLEYEENGRNQTKAEAEELDTRLRGILKDYRIRAVTVETGVNTANYITSYILNTYFNKELLFGIRPMI